MIKKYQRTVIVDKFTIVRGLDGFGSQLLSVFSGMAVSYIEPEKKYFHTPLKGIKLLDKNTEQNSDLKKTNKMIDSIVKNFGFEFVEDKKVNQYPFFHFYIENKGFDSYYTASFRKKISSCYPLPYPPDFEKEKHHISIHIRRGNDIFTEKDINSRIISSDVYSKLVNQIFKKFPNSIIHLFSWTNPNLSLEETKNVRSYFVNSGDLFIEDFNRMVHSDILFVGSSTMSVCAGLLCKGKVIAIPNVSNSNMSGLPIITEWKDNYKEIFSV